MCQNQIPLLCTTVSLQGYLLTDPPVRHIFLLYLRSKRVICDIWTYQYCKCIVLYSCALAYTGYYPVPYRCTMQGLRVFPTRSENARRNCSTILETLIPRLKHWINVWAWHFALYWLVLGMCGNMWYVMTCKYCPTATVSHCGKQSQLMHIRTRTEQPSHPKPSPILWSCCYHDVWLLHSILAYEDKGTTGHEDGKIYWAMGWHSKGVNWITHVGGNTRVTMMLNS